MQESDYEYAGFWVRCGASLIDTALLLAVTLPLMIVIFGWSYFDTTDTAATAGLAEVLINWVLPLALTVWFWRRKSATPGKLLLSLRVLDADSGGPLSVGQSVGRYFAYLLSAFPFCLGFVWIVFDRRRQGWHDKLAGTVVVRLRRRGPEPVSFPRG